VRSEYVDKTSPGADERSPPTAPGDVASGTQEEGAFEEARPPDEMSRENGLVLDHIAHLIGQ